MSIIYKPERIQGIEVLSCTDPFEFQPHIHDRYVIWLNTGGGEHYTVSGRSDILGPGSISIFEPGTVHANRPFTTADRHLRSFYIDAAFFETLAEQVGNRSLTDFHFPDTPLADRRMWHRLADLHELMLGEASDLELSTQVLEVFAAFLERHGTITGQRPETGTCDPRVRRVIDYLHATLSEPVTLDKLAELAGCTQYHLIRLFREGKGLTPHAYLKQLRLEHARRMIEKGDAIVNAAHHSGFSDQSHLTRTFKQRYGVTPKAYQASI